MTPAKKSGPPPGGRSARRTAGEARAAGASRSAAARATPSPSQPTAAPQWPGAARRSTCTTPTACACRSCSRRPASGSRRVCEDLISQGRV